MRLLLVIALFGLLGGCRPPESAANSSGSFNRGAVTVEVEIDGEPVVGKVPVRVTVEENGGGVEGASVEVVGEMTHAGMAPVSARATQVEPGVYLVQEFEFEMAGDWIVSAEVSLADGEQVRSARPVSVRQR